MHKKHQAEFPWWKSGSARGREGIYTERREYGKIAIEIWNP